MTGIPSDESPETGLLNSADTTHDEQRVLIPKQLDFYGDDLLAIQFRRTRLRQSSALKVQPSHAVPS